MNGNGSKTQLKRQKIILHQVEDNLTIFWSSKKLTLCVWLYKTLCSYPSTLLSVLFTNFLSLKNIIPPHSTLCLCNSRAALCRYWTKGTKQKKIASLWMNLAVPAVNYLSSFFFCYFSYYTQRYFNGLWDWPYFYFKYAKHHIVIPYIYIKSIDFILLRTFRVANID